MGVAGTAIADAAEQTVPFKTQPIKAQLSNGQGQRMAQRDAPFSISAEIKRLLYLHLSSQKERVGEELHGTTIYPRD